VQFIKIAVNLVLHRIVVRVSFELVLGPVCQRAPATATGGTLHTLLHIVLPGIRLPRRFAGCVPLGTFLVVGFLQR